MNATKQIIDILSACGCAPTIEKDNNGNDLIKVNAPRVEYTTLFDSDAAENEYIEDMKK